MDAISAGPPLYASLSLIQPASVGTIYGQLSAHIREGRLEEATETAQSLLSRPRYDLAKATSMSDVKDLIEALAKPEIQSLKELKLDMAQLARTVLEATWIQLRSDDEPVWVGTLNDLNARVHSVLTVVRKEEVGLRHQLVCIGETLRCFDHPELSKELQKLRDAITERSYQQKVFSGERPWYLKALRAHWVGQLVADDAQEFQKLLRSLKETLGLAISLARIELCADVLRNECSAAPIALKELRKQAASNDWHLRLRAAQILSGLALDGTAAIQYEAQDILRAQGTDEENSHVIDVLRLSPLGQRIAAPSTVHQEVQRLLQLADQDDPDALYTLGCYYRKGQNVEKNWAKAVRYYKRAAKLQHPQAQLALGLHYHSSGNTSEAVQWFALAAQQECSPALCYLGLYHADGRGVEQSDKMALQYFRQGTKQHDPRSQFCLALCYLHGRGVHPNNEKAAKWLSRAALQDHREANFQLGLLYEVGRGVIQSDKQAALCFKQAAATQGSFELQVLSRPNSVHPSAESSHYASPPGPNPQSMDHYTPINVVNQQHAEYESAKLQRMQQSYDDLPE